MRIHLVLLMTLSLALSACPEPVPVDGDGDGDADADGDGDGDGDADCDPEAECCTDEDCTDRLWCTGIEVCDRGQCEVTGDDVVYNAETGTYSRTCDDGLDCTIDSCDEALNTCVHDPDDSECADDDLCDGTERCDPASADADERGCVEGEPMRCDDGDRCTDDYCEDNECRFTIRDADGDGYGDAGCRVCDPDDPTDCVRGDDCDDSTDAISPGVTEVCDDGMDNNCDRVVDYEDPGCNIPNDGCEDATALEEGVVVYASLRGATSDIESACGYEFDADVAFTFTITEERDVTITVTGSRRELDVSLTGACGDALLERRCRTGRSVGLFARGLPAGTYGVVVSGESDADFEISYTTADSAPRPDGDVCETAPSLTVGTPTTVSTVDAGPDYDMSCAPASLDLLDTVVEIEVPELRHADIDVALASGTGTVVAALQEVCGAVASELICLDGSDSVSGRVWNLPAGTYWLLVGHEAAADLEVTVELVEPAEGDVCASAPTITPDGTTTTVSTVDAGPDYDLPCADSWIDFVDTVVAFEVPADRHADIDVSLPTATGPLVAALVDDCSDPLSPLLCLQADDALASRAWGLSAGTYYLILQHDAAEDIDVSVDLVETVVLYEEDFDTMPDDWTLAGAWAHDTPAGGDDPEPDDGPCVGLGFGGDYPSSLDFADNWVESPEYDLTTATNPYLVFRGWVETETSFDGARLEVSVDGGAYEIVDNPSITPPYNDTFSAGLIWSGTSPAWQTYSVSLADYVGHSIQLRWAFRSDGSLQYSGWFLDSVQILGP